MAEWKLFEGDVPHVSTFEFHKDRERAPHIDQPTHQNRLMTALRMVTQIEAESQTGKLMRFVDLGCGDGGLVAAMRAVGLRAYGYDFQPSNRAGWVERGVDGYCAPLNFVENWPHVMDADVYVITECLEHLANPHAMVRQIYERGAGRGVQIIASSPAKEHAGSHDECHAWAWDMDGYAELMTNAGFTVREQVRDVIGGMFQIIWGV